MYAARMPSAGAPPVPVVDTKAVSGASAGTTAPALGRTSLTWTGGGVRTPHPTRETTQTGRATKRNRRLNDIASRPLLESQGLPTAHLSQSPCQPGRAPHTATAMPCPTRMLRLPSASDPGGSAGSGARRGQAAASSCCSAGRRPRPSRSSSRAIRVGSCGPTGAWLPQHGEFGGLVGVHRIGDGFHRDPGGDLATPEAVAPDLEARAIDGAQQPARSPCGSDHGGWKHRSPGMPCATRLDEGSVLYAHDP